MLVIEGQGLPIGVLVEKSEVKLAGTTLTTVKVCVGRLKIRPKEMRAIDSDTLRWKLRARGSSLAFFGER